MYGTIFRKHFVLSVALKMRHWIYDNNDKTSQICTVCKIEMSTQRQTENITAKRKRGVAT